MSQKTYLVKLGFLLELSQEEYDQYVEKNIMNKFSEDILLKDVDKILHWESTSTVTLDPARMNCGRCSNCNCWVTDREKPYVIEELNNGATVNGKLLCDECLPEDHRWAF